MTIKLKHLNDIPDTAFVDLLGDVAENSPWVIKRAAEQRPYASVRGLHQAVSQVISDASEREQTDLICAHPDLAGKASRAGDMTEASVSEQSGAGLDTLSEEEFDLFEKLNSDYKSKFGIPFIIAVKGEDKASILEAFEARLENTDEAEKFEALRQISEIIRHRLEAMIVHDQ